jgi:hypothetical protein
MNLRSEFIIGKDIFIKLINIKTNVSKFLGEALKDSEKFLPFATKEMVMSYLLSKEENLITPGTKVLVSNDSFDISHFNKYRETDYETAVKDLKKNFIDFEDYLMDITRIKSGIIISKKVDGNLDTFLSSKNENSKEDAFLHVASLYFKYQKKYKAIHGDPKTANYTWLKLDKPIDMTYEFDNFTVKRENVKNLFFLTDLEFAYSPVIKSKKIKGKTFYFNFSKKYEWMNDNRENLMYMPKLSSEPYYNYNVNLYGGYDQKLKEKKGNIGELFGLFPRYLSMDILTLIKMILTWYPEALDSSILRKLDIYFTRFLTLSEKEKEFRYKVDYSSVSPSSFAKILHD